MANDVFEQFFESLLSINKLPNEIIERYGVEEILNKISSSLIGEEREKAINSGIKELKEQRLNYDEVKANSIEFRNSIKEIVEELKPASEEKRKIMAEILSITADIQDEILMRYAENNDAVLFFQFLKSNAKIPTYAHKGDAGADIYAPETVVVPANARGFKVETGLCCAIPDGWEIQIRSRSGMSMKTPLRISNQIGTIDSSYMGEWCILFDNFSDNSYTINAGDRIAQAVLKPSYSFLGKIVDDIHSVKNTERDDGGFGSSGT